MKEGTTTEQSTAEHSRAQQSTAEHSRAQQSTAKVQPEERGRRPREGLEWEGGKKRVELS
jgi:hypothetical protein